MIATINVQYVVKVFLLFTIYEKLISLRKLERECKYDIRFSAILNGEQQSYKTFERFINHDLSIEIEEVQKKINDYIADHTHFCRDILLKIIEKQ